MLADPTITKEAIFKSLFSYRRDGSYQEGDVGSRWIHIKAAPLFGGYDFKETTFPDAAS